MPPSVNRFQCCQHSIAFRFGNSNGISAAGLYHLAKFRFQRLQLVRAEPPVSVDKTLCLIPEVALFRVAGVGEIMCDQSGGNYFHFRKHKRQLATRCPNRCEQFGVSDVSVGSLGKIEVCPEQLAFAGRLPPNTKSCIFWKYRNPMIAANEADYDS